MMTRVSILVGVFGLSLCAGSLEAQVRTISTAPSRVLSDLLDETVELEGPPPGSLFPSHAAHFNPTAESLLVPITVNRAMLSQLVTAPIGSSSSGFSYAYDEATGSFTRTTRSFGPSFAERPATNGRGRWNAGFSFQHRSFDELEGQSLDDGSINFYLRHRPVGTTPVFFEGDVIQRQLRLQLSSSSTVLFANYGVTDAFDVGVVAPIVSVDTSAELDDTILRLATGSVPGTASIHEWPSGDPTRRRSVATGSATGFGDLQIKAKYHFLRSGADGLAATAELRLPTGKEEDLLGVGAAQSRFLLVGARTVGDVTPHFNIGFTVSGSSENVPLNNEFNYVGGIEWVAASRITVAADVVGRTLLSTDTLTEANTQLTFTNVAGVSGTQTIQEFQLGTGNLNLVVGAFGAKFNLVGNLLVSVNGLVSLSQSGLRDRFAPALSLDYSF
jgi:hypothetical protein